VLRLELGFGLGLAFLEDLCDNTEQQKLAYNMSGKFEVSAGKQKKLADGTVGARLLASLEVLVGRLADP